MDERVQPAVPRILGLWLAAVLYGVLANGQAACADSRSSTLINQALSNHSADFTSAVPMIAINARNRNNVVVAWRTFSLPLTRETGQRRSGVCTVSVSMDGGNSFRNVQLPLGTDETPACNAPFVTAAADGTFYAGGSIFAWEPRATDGLWNGNVAVARSTDGGLTWTVLARPIGTGTRDRFVPGLKPLVPELPTPWDGARGFVDRQTGDLYVSGAKAVAPTEEDHAQRYITRSRDQGRTFGPIYSIDSEQWPERWDGSFAPAHGELAVAYVAAATPVENSQCPCAVFGISKDGGATFERVLVGQSADFTTKELVHYPQLAAHPTHAGEYALTLVNAERNQVRILVTQDRGKSWRKFTPAQPANVRLVSRPAVAYSTTGELIGSWRGMYSETSYDLYAAVINAMGIHATKRISTATSTYPPSIAGKRLDGGDFVTWVSAERDMVHFAWPDARTGSISQLYYGRAGLAELLRGNRGLRTR